MGLETLIYVIVAIILVCAVAYACDDRQADRRRDRADLPALSDRSHQRHRRGASAPAVSDQVGL